MRILAFRDILELWSDIWIVKIVAPKIVPRETTPVELSITQMTTLITLVVLVTLSIRRKWRFQ